MPVHQGRERIGCGDTTVCHESPRVALVLSLDRCHQHSRDPGALGSHCTPWHRSATAIAGVLLGPTLLRRGSVRPEGRHLAWTTPQGCVSRCTSGGGSAQLTTVMRSTVLVHPAVGRHPLMAVFGTAFSAILGRDRGGAGRRHRHGLGR